jgi:hypothetical protein
MVKNTVGRLNRRADCDLQTTGEKLHRQWQRTGRRTRLAASGSLFMSDARASRYELASYAVCLAAKDGKEGPVPLCQQFVYHAAMHVGQADVATLKAVGEPRVIEA